MITKISSHEVPDLFYVNADYVGAWWMDLAPDECTMYYTSDGQNVQRYNICTNTQLPNFNNAPLTNNPYAGALGLRGLLRRRGFLGIAVTSL